MHSNITRPARPQWLLLEDRLRDCFRGMGVSLQHERGPGCDYVVCRFFDDDTGQLLQAKLVFSLEALARRMADSGVEISLNREIGAGLSG